MNEHERTLSAALELVFDPPVKICNNHVWSNPSIGQYGGRAVGSDDETITW
jgi:hypothetical protein